MAEMKAQNRTGIRNGNRKILVAAVCVVFSLAVIISVCLFAKNPFYLYLAREKAEKGEFAQAAEIIVKTEGRGSEIFDEYIMLRLDINSYYPEMLTEFDYERLVHWSKTALHINESAKVLGKELSEDAARLSETLTSVVHGISEYEAMRADVLSMMDVFLELNRLHTKGEDGKNIGFTVAEEKEKIRKWEKQCEALEQYSISVDRSESIYLLTYLIKEVQGECTDLEAAIDSVTESGYSETDNVRFSGDVNKKYPDIRSSTASVNLLEKENYEFHLRKGICRALFEKLGEFYNP